METTTRNGPGGRKPKRKSRRGRSHQRPLPFFLAELAGVFAGLVTMVELVRRVCANVRAVNTVGPQSVDPPGVACC